MRGIPRYGVPKALQSRVYGPVALYPGFGALDLSLKSVAKKVGGAVTSVAKAAVATSAAVMTGGASTLIGQAKGGTVKSVFGLKPTATGFAIGAAGGAAAALLPAAVGVVGAAGGATGSSGAATALSVGAKLLGAKAPVGSDGTIPNAAQQTEAMIGPPPSYDVPTADQMGLDPNTGKPLTQAQQQARVQQGQRQMITASMFDGPLPIILGASAIFGVLVLLFPAKKPQAPIAGLGSPRRKRRRSRR